MSHLFDSAIATAVSRIKQRADHQPSPELLTQSFVDTGVLIALDNENDQIMFGRRGTGKTHVLRFLALRSEDVSTCVVFIDGRKLGSSAQFSDFSLPIPQRCRALFRDILLEITNGMEAHLLRFPPDDYHQAEDAITTLMAVVGEPYLDIVPTELQEEEHSSHSKSKKLAGRVGNDGYGIDGSWGRDSTGGTKLAMKSVVTKEDKIFFPSVTNAFEQVFALANMRLMLIIDEWSSIPEDIQPYLAEFIRKSFIPMAQVTLKIAALEHRSTFFRTEPLPKLGLEVGADLAIVRNLDDYYLFELTQEALTHHFGSILYNHLFAELKGTLGTRYRAFNATQLIEMLCSDAAVFKELVHTSEGNLRDFIQIFCRAYSLDYARRSRTLSMDTVRRSAAENSRQKRPTSPTIDVGLTDLMKICIESEGARSFILPARYEKHRLIQELLDARVLHVIDRTFTSLKHIGTEFTRYTIDYGLVLPYVDAGLKIEYAVEQHEPNSRDVAVRGYLDRFR